MQPYVRESKKHCLRRIKVGTVAQCTLHFRTSYKRDLNSLNRISYMHILPLFYYNSWQGVNIICFCLKTHSSFCQLNKNWTVCGLWGGWKCSKTSIDIWDNPLPPLPQTHHILFWKGEHQIFPKGGGEVKKEQLPEENSWGATNRIQLSCLSLSI